MIILLWYAKNKDTLKYRNYYIDKELGRRWSRTQYVQIAR